MNMKVYVKNYQRQAVQKWLKATLGPSHYRDESGKRCTVWMNRRLDWDRYVLTFTNPAHASLFALKWS